MAQVMFLNQLKELMALSTVRQTLWLMGLFGAITLFAWGGTYWMVQREMERTVDDRLSLRMQEAIAVLGQGGSLPDPTDGQSVNFVNDEWPEGFRTFDSEGPRSIEFRYFTSTTPYGRIRLGENTERQEELRDILAAGMQITLVGTLLATALAGLWMARRGQARLGQINAGLAKIAQGQLDTRIALEGRRDDLALLSDRIDATAERLEQAMMQMRVQASNIAHDLRTPMARLRAQIETDLVGLAEHKQAVTVDDLGAALEQIDQITGTFEALLRLARIESGAGREAFTTIDLADLVADVEETFGPVVDEAGQSLTVEVVDAAQISGDHDLLVQLLANLIQNALRHGAEGQTILLGIHGQRLSVSDQGPGIPFAERERVLQPLYQTESTRQGEGFGLGLSLVRAIAELHRADLSLSDGPRGRGLNVSVRFSNLTQL